MTWEEIYTELNVHIEEFERLYKCLNKKNLPKPETTKRNIDLLITQFNALKTKILLHYDTLDTDKKQFALRLVIPLRDKLIKIFTRHRINIKIPTTFENLVNPDIVDTLESDVEDDNEEVMAQTPTDLLRVFAQNINKNYSGEFSSLSAFINSIELLEKITPTEHNDLLKQFILTKLDDKAAEAVPPNPATIKVIKDSLKANIKPDNSKIIEGKMLSLKKDNISHQEFTKQAEELAHAFKRTLIVEGISSDKANEMTIDKTIEMCRATTRSNLVKSVLASSTFPDAKSVIAKFIIESNNDSKEKQILFYKPFHNRHDNQPKNSTFHTHRMTNNFRNFKRTNFDRNRSNRNSNSNFSRNSGQNRNPSNWNTNRNNRYQNRNTNVRYTNSENSDGPLDQNLGAANQLFQEN